ncbi:cheR methyltransferase, SAM binding domain protein [Burkholderia ambifaria AMMD]|uniref:MCP methyltransferase, CheR-type n=1 Tax=Burkholderia ambifaria (strain ATCC BAA-244 / DSM 16087 / CCUG 44356 / LMG 19182 / AMMD) TaxID=339670 RepID=Q0B461_BURCM|nr:CheR family methyltransferase [Burkholderia ambifaria]ABI91062.1 MCP methyltransferase, CheR-type [Burkholderia ambifaria AMMD]AJY25887.1 cheR methyltransferase, SAM binding domain protein [Burkholderia ambifaria AMMD]MBR7933501.1 MCP methyltransferase [Burkholderia ambifaria]PEH69035.1 MCP methyltransferase [Burkholderia ambifaria]QQC06370.1 MCP methyltransferase [Burkholderia ambifaria]
MKESDSRFRGWLLRETGIDPDSLGNDFLSRALTERIHALQGDGERLPSAARPAVTPEALDAYWQQLNASADERRALIELFVVPETWFFRDREAFATLARLALERLAATPGRVIRVLSAPCSTGEEPYSAAMALLDAGLDPASFMIDALDLSVRAIEQARLGCYGRNAFRGTATEFRARYFTPAADGWLLDERVRARVQFRQANLIEPGVDTGIRYDFVFCRNVLIYFDRDAQDRVIGSLDSWLADDGMLFVGPAETGVAMRHGLRSARVPLAFAFHRDGGGAAVGAAADASAARYAAPTPVVAPYRRAERLTVAPPAAARPLLAVVPPTWSGNASSPAALAPAERRTAFEPLADMRAGSLTAAATAATAGHAAHAASATNAASAANAANATTAAHAASAASAAKAANAANAALPPPPADIATPTLEEAQALANAGAFDEAERVLARFSAHAGPHADAFYLNGLIADACGRVAEAGDFYRKALYLRPTHHEALTHLATLLDVGGDGAGAQWLLERARRAAG